MFQKAGRLLPQVKNRREHLQGRLRESVEYDSQLHVVWSSSHLLCLERTVNVSPSRHSGLQPDDQLQVIENVLLDCDRLCCIRSKMLSFEQNGPGSQTVHNRKSRSLASVKSKRRTTYL